MEWRKVKGYEESYEISEYGNVRGIDRIDYGGHKITGREIKPKKNNRGYVQIRLQKDGKTHHWLLHRLVATNFMENPDSLPQINHKDEDKNNNHFSNLEWCTNMYNRHYGTGLQRMVMNTDYSKNAERMMIPIAQYDLNDNLIKIWGGMVLATKYLGRKASNSHISECCAGNRPTAYGFKWRKLNV